jgi:hypothetical protein
MIQNLRRRQPVATKLQLKVAHVGLRVAVPSMARKRSLNCPVSYGKTKN